MGESTSRDPAIVTFGPCCFCGEHIAKTAVDPCRITVQTTTSARQVWFCHAQCFEARLIPGRNLEPGIF